MDPKAAVLPLHTVLTQSVISPMAPAGALRQAQSLVTSSQPEASASPIGMRQLATQAGRAVTAGKAVMLNSAAELFIELVGAEAMDDMLWDMVRPTAVERKTRATLNMMEIQRSYSVNVKIWVKWQARNKGSCNQFINPQPRPGWRDSQPSNRDGPYEPLKPRRNKLLASARLAWPPAVRLSLLQHSRLHNPRKLAHFCTTSRCLQAKFSANCSLVESLVSFFPHNIFLISWCRWTFPSDTTYRVYGVISCHVTPYTPYRVQSARAENLKAKSVALTRFNLTQLDLIF
jgi:hypothetical protein